MTLPKSENFPDDPERLPPARRRRARRLLAPLEADERADLLAELGHRASPTFDFFLLSLVSGGVIATGLLLDSQALIFLGAILAPFMGPAIGVSLGTVVGSGRFFIRNLAGLLIGSALAFGGGALAGAVSQSLPPAGLNQAYFYAQLSWFNFLILAVGAILTAFAMAHAGRGPVIASAALAYALYIPLVVAGLGITSGIPHLWPDGLVIYALHLAWAVLFGAFALAAKGFRPLTLFGYTLGGAVTLIGVMLLIGLTGAGAVFGAQMGLPTPLPTATYTPTPIPPTATLTSTPVPPTATLTPTLTPTITLTPSPTPSPTPVPVYARINASNESGGAFLRSTPGFGSQAVTTLANGTLVQVLPDTEEIDSYIWVHVLVPPSGQEGWILQTLLEIATPVPGW